MLERSLPMWNLEIRYDAGYCCHRTIYHDRPGPAEVDQQENWTLSGNTEHDHPTCCASCMSFMPTSLRNMAAGATRSDTRKDLCDLNPRSPRPVSDDRLVSRDDKRSGAAI
jgi:hypothetical protein